MEHINETLRQFDNMMHDATYKIQTAMIDIDNLNDVIESRTIEYSGFVSELIKDTDKNQISVLTVHHKKVLTESISDMRSQLLRLTEYINKLERNTDSMFEGMSI